MVVLWEVGSRVFTGKTSKRHPFVTQESNA